MKNNMKNIACETYHYEPQKVVAFNAKAVLRVAAYTRVSTLSENQEDSFETQCAYYEKMIAANPKMILVGIYGDQGVSGLSTKGRTEFGRMIRDCRAGKIDMVITRSVSRLSRNMKECVETINELVSLGIPVVFEKEGITTGGAANEMFFHIMATMAQEESGSLSRKIQWAVDSRAEMGDPIRKCAYGYRKVPLSETHGVREGREWLINEKEASRVKKAFRMASDGCCYEEIIRSLNELEQAENTDVTWNRQRLTRMLRNEVYAGDIRTHKTYTVDYLTKQRAINRGERDSFYISEHHEPIVSLDTFESVQRLMDDGRLHSGRWRSRAYGLQPINAI